MLAYIFALVWMKKLLENAYGKILNTIYMSQALKLGYGIHIVVHVWLVKGKRLGMLVIAQASQCDSTAHAQRLFLPKWRSRWLWHHQMMSLSFCLCKWRVVYKKTHMSPGVLLLVLCLWFILWLIHSWSHRSSVSATSVPLKEWDHHTGKCSLFAHLYVLKVILNTLS